MAKLARWERCEQEWFSLPDLWRPYLLRGERAGLFDSEIAEADQFMERLRSVYGEDATVTYVSYPEVGEPDYPPRLRDFSPIKIARYMVQSRKNPLRRI